MNLAKLFEMQKVLRQRIIEQHKLENIDLLPNLVLGLSTELGELANETRCFKHWSVKPPNAKEVILEEYADVLHFILEIGLSEYVEHGERFPIMLNLLNYDPIKYKTLTAQFNSMYTEIGILSDLLFENCYTANSVGDSYNHLVRLFHGLGEMLGFTWQEIEQAYIKKNKVNHERQNNGY